MVVVYNTPYHCILPDTDNPHQPMSNIKVLTLGWEFPPLVNGGLGIACLGLSKALAKKVDLRVIVPKADPSVHTDGFQLTGLNNVSFREVEQVDRKYSYESFAMVEHAPIELDPYTTVEGETGMIQFTQEGRISFSRTHEADLQLFKNKEDLYAGDLALKVIQFSKIAAKIAMQQDFDVIHAHDWMTYLAGVEVKKATASPWWCTCTPPSSTAPERMPAAGFTTLKNSAWNRRTPSFRSASTRAPSSAAITPLTRTKSFPSTTGGPGQGLQGQEEIPGKARAFPGTPHRPEGPPASSSKSPPRCWSKRTTCALSWPGRGKNCAS